MYIDRRIVVFLTIPFPESRGTAASNVDFYLCMCLCILYRETYIFHFSRTEKSLFKNKRITNKSLERITKLHRRDIRRGKVENRPRVQRNEQRLATIRET